MIAPESTEQKVVDEIIVRKREYTRIHTRLCRLRKKKCGCGAQAVYTELSTKKNLCLGCLILNEKNKVGT